MKLFYLEKVCKEMRHLYPLRCVIQPFRETPEGSCRTLGHIHKESPARAVPGSQFCGQHSVKGVPQPMHPYPQDFPRYSQEGQMLHGMVLRLQAPHHMQRERGSAELNDNAGRCRWQETSWIQGFCGVSVWQARSGQGITNACSNVFLSTGYSL